MKRIQSLDIIKRGSKFPYDPPSFKVEVEFRTKMEREVKESQKDDQFLYFHTCTHRRTAYQAWKSGLKNNSHARESLFRKWILIIENEGEWKRLMITNGKAVKMSCQSQTHSYELSFQVLYEASSIIQRSKTLLLHNIESSQIEEPYWSLG